MAHRSTSAADFLLPRRALSSLRGAAHSCKGCDLYKNATQTVFGEGPQARGETPGAAKARLRRGSRLRVRKVKTVSTAPPKDLFTKDAQTIARTMARKSVSPKGIGSGIRMIQYYINRAGKKLSATRRRELEKAKAILQRRRKAKKELGKSSARENQLTQISLVRRRHGNIYQGGSPGL